MMCKNSRVIQILVLVSGLFLCRVPVLADTKTYTTTADFDEGTYINLNATGADWTTGTK